MIPDARMFPPGCALSPSGVVRMSECGRRGEICKRERKRGTCTWCSKSVTPPRRTWCSDECVDAYKATQPNVLRSRVFERDARDTWPTYACELCEYPASDMDHRVPIIEGGHPFELTNLRLLCTDCHAGETRRLAGRRAARARKVEAMNRQLAPMAAGLMKQVTHLLGFADVAEQEIARAKQAAPEHADAIDRAFAALMPGPLADYGPELYRAHVRELLDRVVDGLALDLGTDAEICASLCFASLKAPLGQQPVALYERTFARCFPEQAGTVLDGPHTAEPWRGASDELAAQLRRRLRNPQRVLRARQDARAQPVTKKRARSPGRS